MRKHDRIYSAIQANVQGWVATPGRRIPRPPHSRKVPDPDTGRSFWRMLIWLLAQLDHVHAFPSQDMAEDLSQFAQPIIQCQKPENHHLPGQRLSPSWHKLVLACDWRSLACS